MQSLCVWSGDACTARRPASLLCGDATGQVSTCVWRGRGSGRAACRRRCCAGWMAAACQARCRAPQPLAVPGCCLGWEAVCGQQCFTSPHGAFDSSEALSPRHWCMASALPLPFEGALCQSLHPRAPKAAQPGPRASVNNTTKTAGPLIGARASGRCAGPCGADARRGRRRRCGAGGGRAHRRGCRGGRRRRVPWPWWGPWPRCLRIFAKALVGVLPGCHVCPAGRACL